MVMDGRNTGFQSDAFDVILIGGVIHHLNNADGNAILKEACRVLKPRGKLIIWEDIPALNDANIIGRLIHRLDDGDHIRSAAQYIDIVKTYFSITKEYTMTSGVCDYIVITGQKILRRSGVINGCIHPHGQPRIFIIYVPEKS